MVLLRGEGSVYGRVIESYKEGLRHFKLQSYHFFGEWGEGEVLEVQVVW